MLGRTSRQRSEMVRAVRVELAAMHRSHGISDLDIARLEADIRRVSVQRGEPVARDRLPWLVAAALGMWPRPPWVSAVVGPYPANLELANPDDTASVDEWGSAG